MLKEQQPVSLLTLRPNVTEAKWIDDGLLPQWGELGGSIHDAMGSGKSGVDIWKAVSSEFDDVLRHGSPEDKKAVKLFAPNVAHLLIGINNMVAGEKKQMTMKQLMRAGGSHRVNRYLKSG